MTGKILPTERAAIYSIINILNRRKGIEKVKLLTLVASVDELTSVKAFNSYEILSSELVLIWVSENNFGKRSSTAWIVNDFLHNTLDVPNSKLAIKECAILPFSLGVIKSSELSWCDSLRSVSFEYCACSLSLGYRKDFG